MPLDRRGCHCRGDPAIELPRCARARIIFAGMRVSGWEEQGASSREGLAEPPAELLFCSCSRSAEPPETGNFRPSGPGSCPNRTPSAGREQFKRHRRRLGARRGQRLRRQPEVNEDLLRDVVLLDAGDDSHRAPRRLATISNAVDKLGSRRQSLASASRDCSSSRPRPLMAGTPSRPRTGKTYPRIS